MYKFQRSLPTVEIKDAFLTTKKVLIDPDKFVSTKDQFELTYLRWRYFMRTANPPNELIKRYEKAAYKVAKEFFNENYEAMKNSGLEIEDVCNVALVHLVSYIGCYSLQFSEIGKNKVNEKRKKQEYSEEEVKRKDLSNMMVFIQQRMKDLIRVFRQKNRNVLGENQIAMLFQLVDKEKPCTDFELIKTPDKYGYRKVLPSQYKEIKRKLGSYPSVGKFVLNNIVYRYVYFYSNPIWISDHENHEDMTAFNPQYGITAQEDLHEKIQKYRIEKLLDKYNSAELKNKARMLKKAISFFKRKGMTSELSLAKNLLDKLQYGKER